MKLEHILDLRENQHLSDLYTIICYNIRCASKEYIASLNPEDYQRFRILNNFRQDILQYLLNTYKISSGEYARLACNSDDFCFSGKNKKLIELVDILK